MSKIQNPLNARHIEHNDGQDSCIARKGSVPKRSNDGPVPVSFGMTNLQKAGAGVGGQGHGVAAITDGGQTIAASAAAAPLRHAYSAAPDLKTGKAVPPSFAQRSRTNEGVETFADKVQHGRDSLSVAVKGGGRS